MSCSCPSQEPALACHLLMPPHPSKKDTHHAYTHTYSYSSLSLPPSPPPLPQATHQCGVVLVSFPFSSSSSPPPASSSPPSQQQPQRSLWSQPWPIPPLPPSIRMKARAATSRRCPRSGQAFSICPSPVRRVSDEGRREGGEGGREGRGEGRGVILVCLLCLLVCMGDGREGRKGEREGGRGGGGGN